jgi:hypothetical protein
VTRPHQPFPCHDCSRRLPPAPTRDHVCRRRLVPDAHGRHRQGAGARDIQFLHQQEHDGQEVCAQGRTAPSRCCCCCCYCCVCAKACRSASPVISSRASVVECLRRRTCTIYTATYACTHPRPRHPRAYHPACLESHANTSRAYQWTACNNRAHTHITTAATTYRTDSAGATTPPCSPYFSTTSRAATACRR